MNASEYPRWDRDSDGRDESTLERLDRNWASLLQELRVVQTGVQVLTGLLLTLPFQARFDELGDYQRDVYLVTVLASICATVFLVAPVGMHRLLFRRGQLDRLVITAHRFTLAGIAFLGIALTGAVVLVVGVVFDSALAGLVGACVALLFIVVWVLYPWWFRLRTHSHTVTEGTRPPHLPPRKRKSDGQGGSSSPDVG